MYQQKSAGAKVQISRNGPYIVSGGIPLGGEHAMKRQVAELRHVVLDAVPGRRMGYVTDLRYTDANIETLAHLLADVHLLFIESVFLAQDQAHAARKNHLTARQAGDIARRVGAKAIVPFHRSPRYAGRSDEPIAEARAAWSGSSVRPRAGPG